MSWKFWKRQPPMIAAPPKKHWALRLAIYAGSSLLVFGWTRRAALAPLYAAVVLFIAGSAAHLPARGGTSTVLLLGVVAAISAGLWLRRRRKKSQPVTRNGRILLWTSLVLVFAWAAQQAHRGISRFGLAWLTIMLVAGWIIYAVIRHRRADQASAPVEVLVEPAAPLEELHEVVRIWMEHVRNQGGALPNSSLTDITEYDDGNVTAAEIMLVPGVQTTASAMGATMRIASAFGKPAGSVIISPSRTDRADRARLAVTKRNQTYWPKRYDESWICENSGCVPLLYSHDGERVWIRLWEENEGASNTWISGDTKGGKSRTTETLITQAAFTGHVIPIVCDPQGGASLQAWCGLDGFAPVKARTLDEIEDVIDAVLRASDNRTAYINAVQWTDKRGNPRRGINRWSPQKCPDLPMLMLTVDEFASLVAQRPSLGAKLDIIAKTGSKLGIKLVVITQGTNISENFNGLDSLRQNLKAGNIIAHRISSITGGSLALHNSAISPADIPMSTPDGLSTKGMAIVQGCAEPPPPPGMHRSVHQDETDAYYWAGLAAQRIPAFHPLDLAAFAGTTYHPATGDTVGTRPAGTAVTASSAPAPTDTAAPQRQTVAVGRADANTIEQILALLETGPLETGVIAARLNMATNRVSMALRRESDLGDTSRVIKVTHGIWGLAGVAEPLQLAAAA